IQQRHLGNGKIDLHAHAAKQRSESNDPYLPGMRRKVSEVRNAEYPHRLKMLQDFFIRDTGWDVITAQQYSPAEAFQSVHARTNASAADESSRHFPSRPNWPIHACSREGAPAAKFGMTMDKKPGWDTIGHSSSVAE